MFLPNRALLCCLLFCEVKQRLSKRSNQTAFVAMRRFIATNAQYSTRLDTVERKQLDHKRDADEKFQKNIQRHRKQRGHTQTGDFLQWPDFDAYRFVSDLFRTRQEINNHHRQLYRRYRPRASRQTAWKRLGYYSDKIDLKTPGAGCKKVQWTIPCHWN